MKFKVGDRVTTTDELLKNTHIYEHEKTCVNKSLIVTDIYHGNLFPYTCKFLNDQGDTEYNLSEEELQFDLISVILEVLSEE